MHWMHQYHVNKSPKAACVTPWILGELIHVGLTNLVRALHLELVGIEKSTALRHLGDRWAVDCTMDFPV